MTAILIGYVVLEKGGTNCITFPCGPKTAVQ